MTSATGTHALSLDEAGFVEALDALSPGLLGLAGCFAPDHETAERMVEQAWHSALRGELGGGRLAVALARRMAVAAPLDPPALGRARQQLRLALASGERPPMPGQRDRRRTAGTGVPLDLGLSTLPPALRVVVVLHDVHGWPAGDVEALLAVAPADVRRLLGLARGALVHLTAGEAV